LDPTRKTFQDKKSLLETYMGYRNTPKEIQQRLLAYSEFMYAQGAVEEDTVLSSIPPSLRTQVLSSIYSRVVNSMHLFSGCDSGLIEEFQSSLRTVYYPPFTDLIVPEKQSTELFCLRAGKVLVSVLVFRGGGRVSKNQQQQQRTQQQQREQRERSKSQTPGDDDNDDNKEESSSNNNNNKVKPEEKDKDKDKQQAKYIIQVNDTTTTTTTASTTATAAPTKTKTTKPTTRTKTIKVKANEVTRFTDNNNSAATEIVTEEEEAEEAQRKTVRTIEPGMCFGYQGFLGETGNANGTGTGATEEELIYSTGEEHCVIGLFFFFCFVCSLCSSTFPSLILSLRPLPLHLFLFLLCLSLSPSLPPSSSSSILFSVIGTKAALRSALQKFPANRRILKANSVTLLKHERSFAQKAAALKRNSIVLATAMMTTNEATQPKKEKEKAKEAQQTTTTTTTATRTKTEKLDEGDEAIALAEDIPLTPEEKVKQVNRRRRRQRSSLLSCSCSSSPWFSSLLFLSPSLLFLPFFFHF
jgi:hypothetical protein